jgi:hypothetical protein
MYMIMFVLDDPDQLDTLLDAWVELGVSGITLVESSGFHRRRAHVPGARYVGSLPDLVEEVARGSFTLFAAVADEALVQACFAATERIVGDLSQPNTGIIAAWPLSFGKGLEKRQPTVEVDA